jgi:hypothetical protein
MSKKKGRVLTHEPRPAPIQDPTEQHPDSLLADQLDHPGLESDMSHAPDFGEHSYRGTGKLEG